MEGLMSVTRRPATSQVPLARVARLAGETFGHQSASDGALTESAYSGQARSALAFVIILCVMAAVYLAI
jgi:hypothetical protein